MDHLQHAFDELTDERLDRIRGGMFPYRPQAGPVFDRSVNPRGLVAVMGAGAVTGALGGAAVGGVGALPGSAGGALLGGIGYTAGRLLNPTQVLPAMPFAVCHGSGPAANPTPCHRPR